MKRIVKNLPNKPLEKWRKKQVPQHLVYGNLRDPDREDVLKWLINEQGALCCYTGIRIWSNSKKPKIKANCHIEHLKPQTICVAEDRERGDNQKEREDISGANLLAAFPNQPDWSYGAKFRQHWYGEDKHNRPANLFIHPLMVNCESRFKFDVFGKISAAEKKDNAAKMTIKKLCLDHGDLNGRRYAAIRQVFFSARGPLSEPQILKIMDGLDKRDSKGEFRAFCFVLKQVGEQLLAISRRKHQRRVAIQKSQKSQKTKKR